jgi:citrate lyase gamma subunit
MTRSINCVQLIKKAIVFILTQVLKQYEYENVKVNINHKGLIHFIYINKIYLCYTLDFPTQVNFINILYEN